MHDHRSAVCPLCKLSYFFIVLDTNITWVSLQLFLSGFFLNDPHNLSSFFINKNQVCCITWLKSPSFWIVMTISYKVNGRFCMCLTGKSILFKMGTDIFLPQWFCNILFVLDITITIYSIRTAGYTNSAEAFNNQYG